METAICWHDVKSGRFGLTLIATERRDQAHSQSSNTTIAALNSGLIQR